MLQSDSKLEVICHCYEKGKINPLRIRIEEQEVQHFLNIDRVVSVRESRLNGSSTNIYECESIINERMISFELHFEKDICQWRLYR